MQTMLYCYGPIQWHAASAFPCDDQHAVGTATQQQQRSESQRLRSIVEHVQQQKQEQQQQLIYKCRFNNNVKVTIELW